MSQIYLSCHVLDFRRKFSSNFISFLFFSRDTLPLNVLLVLLFCFIQWLSVLHALCIISCQLLTYRDLSWKLLTVLEVYKEFMVWYLFLLKAILLTVCTLGLSVLHQREPQWQWPVLFFATDWFSNQNQGQYSFKTNTHIYIDLIRPKKPDRLFGNSFLLEIPHEIQFPCHLKPCLLLFTCL